MVARFLFCGCLRAINDRPYFLMRSALSGTFLYFACGQADDEVGVIGLDFGFVGGFVTRDFTATVATMHQDISTLRVWDGADGAHFLS